MQSSLNLLTQPHERPKEHDKQNNRKNRERYMRNENEHTYK